MKHANTTSLSLRALQALIIGRLLQLFWIYAAAFAKVCSKWFFFYLGGFSQRWLESQKLLVLGRIWKFKLRIHQQQIRVIVWDRFQQILLEQKSLEGFSLVIQLVRFFPRPLLQNWNSLKWRSSLIHSCKNDFLSLFAISCRALVFF